MRNSKEFNIYTLDGDEILKSYDIYWRYDEDSQCEIRDSGFKVDLSKDLGKMRYIKENDHESIARDDNAYFYQIRKCYGFNDNDEECLKNKIVIVEFGKYYEKLKNLKEEKGTKDNIEFGSRNEGYSPIILDNQKVYSPENQECSDPEFYDDTLLDEALEIRGEDIDHYFSYSDLLRDAPSELFSKGFNIKFSEDCEIHFVQGLKSASMARSNRVCFIDEACKDELEKRLDLGMQIKNFPGVIAKTEAYYGLYLTSGERINSLQLNEKSVIVIDDIKKESLISIKTYKRENTKKGSLESEEKDEEKDIVFELEERDEEKDINSFDGMGIISWNMASEIAGQYAGADNSELASFQIRMPFIKGMLHKVDFHSFLEEYAPDCANGHSIIDYFGIPRKLDEVEIILTESMFKQCKSLKRFCESNPEIKDPMKFFFEGFDKYDHALYVSNTEKPYVGRNLVSLNYQFLSTLSPEDGDRDKIATSLLEYHKKYVINPIPYIRSFADIWDNNENISENDLFNSNIVLSEDEASKDDEYSESDLSDDSNMNKKKSEWVYAVLKDSAFSLDPYIKKELKKNSDQLKISLIPGRILVDGEIRYLSGDLLYFLKELINKCNEKRNRKSTDVDKELLNENEMYMPRDDNEDSIIPDSGYLTVLRSPHLSEYEDCALKMWEKPAKKSECIREKYLKHLKGCLMVAADSAAPMILGGADFDGDLVKVIHNDLYTESILNYAYDKDTKERSLPVIDIPKEYSQELEQKGYVPNFIIKDTFSNNVGKISNTAITLNQIKANIKQENIDNLFNLEGGIFYRLTGNRKSKYKSDNDKDKLIESKKRELKELDTAECTLLTGLDIDAVKTGKRPQERIDEIVRITDQYKSILSMVYIKDIIKPYQNSKKGNKQISFKKFIDSNLKITEENSLGIYERNMLDVLVSKIPEISKDKSWKMNIDANGKNKVPFCFIKDIKRIQKTSRYDELKSLMDQYCSEKNCIEYALRSYRYSMNPEIFRSRIQEIQEKQGNSDPKLTKVIDDLLNDHKWTVDTIKNAITILESSEWPYLINNNEKEAFLCRDKKNNGIFSAIKDKLEQEHLLDSIYNFSARGYCLLYFILKLIEVKVAKMNFSLFDRAKYYHEEKYDQEPRFLTSEDKYDEMTKKLMDKEDEYSIGNVREDLNRRYFEAVKLMFKDAPDEMFKYLYCVADEYDQNRKKSKNSDEKYRYKSNQEKTLEFFWTNISRKDVDLLYVKPANN